MSFEALLARRQQKITGAPVVIKKYVQLHHT
jgi:hypothetical protein